MCVITSSFRELKCHNSALGGILRSALERSKDKISMIEKKRLSTEFKRIGDMLLEAANPSCVLLDSQTGAISQLPLLALQELQVRLPSDVQQNIDSFTLLGDVFDTAVKVHDAYFNVTNDERKNVIYS